MADSRSDKLEQVKVEKEQRMARVTIPPEGVRTLGEKIPTTTGENVRYFYMTVLGSHKVFSITLMINILWYTKS